MKISVLLVTLVTLQTVMFAQPASNNKADTAIWFTDFEQARRVSFEKSLPVMLVFSGSDWCKPCIMLRSEILDSPEFVAFARKNLVLLQADFPRLKKNRLTEEQISKNEALARKFNKKGQFPYVVLLKGDETILGTEGYHKATPEEYVQLIHAIIKK